MDDQTKDDSQNNPVSGLPHQESPREAGVSSPLSDEPTNPSVSTDSTDSSQGSATTPPEEPKHTPRYLWVLIVLILIAVSLVIVLLLGNTSPDKQSIDATNPPAVIQEPTPSPQAQSLPAIESELESSGPASLEAEFEKIDEELNKL